LKGTRDEFAKLKKNDVRLESNKLIVFSIMLIIVSSIMLVEAKDLGVFGELFEIAEENLLEQIQSKLLQLEKTGYWETAKKKIQRKVKEMILHPQAINGITHTKKTRIFSFDPAITVSRDLRDHRGHVFAKKGERFNPLEKINFSKSLLFIDGGDEDHINWAISKIKDYQTVGHDRAKIILVKGSPLELQKRLHRDIYFDQQGILTSKFGIKHVPAVVFQKADEKFLTITEERVSK
jgi:conjugal transfer pilus assembly protein TraW